MLSTPLEDYLPAYAQRTELQKKLTYGCSTALIRGYVGLWKLENGRLFLVDIYRCGQRDESVIRDFFDTSSPIEAIWFTGELAIQHGELIKYFHIGFNRYYEEETVVQIEKGRQLSEQHFVNGYKPGDTGFIDDREAIADEFFSRIKWENVPELSDKYRFSVGFILQEVDSIWILRGTGPDACKKEVQRVIDGFPNIKDFYYRGKPILENFFLYVTFSERAREKMKKKK